MSPRQRVLRIFIVLASVIALGIIGYMILEGWSLLDATYMTIITLSTVGYAEVKELSTAGRIFSIVLIVFGVGGMLYTLTTIVQYLVEGQLMNVFGRRRMRERIANLKDHIILCGYHRVGRAVASIFTSEGIPFIAIDVDNEAIAKAAVDGCLYIHGNATSDEILEQAGIRKARALVAALGSDIDNVYITLSAKEMRPEIFVVARISSEDSETKMRRAGADRIILPHQMGGRRMALLTLRPLVVDFFDETMPSRGGDMVLENVKVGPGSPLVGVNVGEGLNCCGATAILAVRKADGKLIANPPVDTPLELGDELVIIGTREQLRVLEGSV